MYALGSYMRCWKYFGSVTKRDHTTSHDTTRLGAHLDTSTNTIYMHVSFMSKTGLRKLTDAALQSESTEIQGFLPYVGGLPTDERSALIVSDA